MAGFRSSGVTSGSTANYESPPFRTCFPRDILEFEQPFRPRGALSRDHWNLLRFRIACGAHGISLHENFSSRTTCDSHVIREKIGDWFTECSGIWEIIPGKTSSRRICHSSLMTESQHQKTISRPWHDECKATSMSATHSSPDSSLDSREYDYRAGSISNGAARAGREVVWLCIAAAFFVLEAVVFVTDLPVSKIFSRRDLPKTAARGR